MNHLLDFRKISTVVGVMCVFIVMMFEFMAMIVMIFMTVISMGM